MLTKAIGCYLRSTLSQRVCSVYLKGPDPVTSTNEGQSKQPDSLPVSDLLFDRLAKIDAESTCLAIAEQDAATVVRIKNEPGRDRGGIRQKVSRAVGGFLV